MHRPLKWFSSILMIASLSFVANALVAQNDSRGNDTPRRYRGLDRNNDARISRDEWRGSPQAFSKHDMNRDGVLSNNEIQMALNEERYDDFSTVDSNRDGMVSRGEWRWDGDEFSRLDGNRDRMLARQEYQGEYRTGSGAYSHGPSHEQNLSVFIQDTPDRSARDRHARFRQLDRNGNGRITLNEWDGDRRSFSKLDVNRNRSLSRDEFSRSTAGESRALFDRFDRNGNGMISRTEWRGDVRSFARLDLNRDGRVEHGEFARSYRAIDQRFGELDRDDSGTLSRREWRGQRGRFNRADDNRNGQISFMEFFGIV